MRRFRYSIRDVISEKIFDIENKFGASYESAPILFEYMRFQKKKRQIINYKGKT